MTSERTGRDLEPPVFSSAARAREQRSGRPRALRAAEREDASDRAGTRSSLAGVGSEPYPSIENRYFDCTKEWLERSLLLLLFPVWLALFLGIYCALYFPNRGQVLFTQPRVGKSGRRFAVFKFRTLRSGVVQPIGNGVGPTRRSLDLKQPRAASVSGWMAAQDGFGRVAAVPEHPQG
jgi:hypothetical protein